MSANENKTIPKIDGYTDEQVQFVFTELQSGASPLTIQLLLYRKFALYEEQADDLIARVQQATGVKPVVHNLDAEVEAYHAKKFIEKGMDKETASQMAKQEVEKTNRVDAPSSGGGTMSFWGVIVLIIAIIRIFRACYVLSN
jgi:hypothetical protein